ncbi:unnamed protein product [Sphagnum troendelagicum]|uniref:protein-serine/threonine phosphatase n=1 Tax=Sphagnum troendelagicum TaxID=128251 RepID=A0ABP0UF70_9BRYO
MADNEDSTLVPNEDQEEGEISDEEDHLEEEHDPGETKEVTDLPARDDFIPRGRRTEANYPSSHFRNGLGIEDDELEVGTPNVWGSGDGNPWGRDPIAAFRPPGNIYAPNMYNFAWAQAVQGGRSIQDDDDDDVARGGAPPPSADSKSAKQSSTDEIPAADDREEGELEEGEIELPSQVLPKSSTSSKEQSEDHQHNNNMPSRDRDTERERQEQLSQVGMLVKNVTVKDAQKSFISICHRLNKAVMSMNNLVEERKPAVKGRTQGELPRDVSNLVNKTFQGIRAVYAVWSTASGKEQDRDKDTFPRLLELVNSSGSKLFTPKQVRELREFMDQVSKVARKARFEGVDQHFQQVPKSLSESLQERELRDREASPTPKSAISHTCPPIETPSTEMLGPSFADTKQAADAAAIAAAAIAYAQSSAAAFANLSHGSMSSKPSNGYADNEQGSWAWNGRTSPYEESAMPGMPSSYPLVRHGDTSMFGAGVYPQASDIPPQSSASTLHPFEDSKGSYAQSSAEEEWEEMNKFHLPSPTPSEDDEENQGTEPSPIIPTEEQQKALRKLPITLENVPLQYPNSVHTTLKMQPDQMKTISMASLKSRDPRRQFCKPHIDLESYNVQFPNQSAHQLPEIAHQLQPGQFPTIRNRETFEEESSHLEPATKRLKTTVGETRQPASDHFLGAPASGGWIEDTVAAYCPNVDDDGVTAMEIAVQSPSTVIEGLPYAGLSGAGLGIPEKARVDFTNLTTISQLGASNKQKKEGVGGDLGEALTNNNLTSDNLVAEGKEATPSSLSNAPDWVEKFPSHDMGSSARMQNEVGDGSKHRMRPRDPRRFLMGALVEKTEGSSGISLTQESAGLGASSHQTKDSTPLAVKIASPSVAPSAGYAQPPSILSKDEGVHAGLADGQPQLDDRLTGSALVEMSSEAQSLSQNRSMFPPNGAKPPVDDSDSSEIRKGPVDPDFSSVNPVVENVFSEEPARTGDEKPRGGMPRPGTVDSLLPRKPRVGPSQWGGGQVHPDMEQLLGTLDEAERFAVKQERERRMEEQDRMFSAGKLCLVLDLDHTLLNSAKFAEIEPEWEPRLRAAEFAERTRASREGHAQRELYRFPHMGMWTKLRPGIWRFLARASQLYELHVYTMGNKAYATEMAKVLDPTGTLFAGRVISKGDENDALDSDDRPPKSKDLDGVLGMESAVVIIDDSLRVWPHHRENLIVVERYMYFPCSRRQFGLLGPSLLEVGHDERAADGMLSSALVVIDRIHEQFFANQRLREVDVREILAAEQRRVLTGCCILFSRIFPVGEMQPHMHPLWRMAEQFGANCCLTINDKVTHVVAISLGTDKVNWATATGRPVVRPGWVEASAILYRRANEQDFPVPP